MCDDKGELTALADFNKFNKWFYHRVGEYQQLVSSTVSTCDINQQVVAALFGNNKESKIVGKLKFIK
jgi:hypothetical protein